MGKKKNTQTLPLTSEIRGLLRQVAQDELRGLPQRLESLTEQERVHVLLELLPYVAPRVKPQDATDATDGDVWAVPEWKN